MGVFKDEPVHLHEVLNDQFALAEGLMGGRTAQPQEIHPKAAVKQTPPQEDPHQKVISSMLRLDPALVYDLHIGPPKQQASSPSSVVDELRHIYDAIKAEGTAGIKYESGEGRAARSPNEVLSSLKGNCEELSLLFVAAARQLNIASSDISMLRLTFEVEKDGVKKPVQLHMALLDTGKEKYLIDLTFGHFQQLNTLDSAEIVPFYVGRTIIPDTGVISGIAKVEKIGNLGEMVTTNLMQSVSFYLGKKQLTTDDLTALMGCLEKAYQADKSYPNVIQDLVFVYESLAKAELDNNKYASAAVYYEKALGISPADPNLHSNLGLIMERQGQTAEAWKEYEKVLKLAPDSSAYWNATVMSLEVGNYPAAEAHFTKLHAVHPASLEVLELGINLYVKMEHERSIAMKGAWISDPEVKRCLVNLLSISNAVLLLAPSDPYALFDRTYAAGKLGMIASAGGNYSEAKSRFEEAIATGERAITSDLTPGMKKDLMDHLEIFRSNLQMIQH
jgi:tetratricopeptide (TPR) repeat protein